MNSRKLGLLLAQKKPILAAPSLDDAIEVAKVLIDQDAETARKSLITPGSGQAMSYQEKAKQAENCLGAYTSSNPPPIGEYVLLDSEVGIMKNADNTLTANAFEVATVIDATRQAWLLAEASINTIRVQGKAGVAAATDAAAIQDLVDGLAWPKSS